jgi:hypothetical protein
MGQWRYSFTPRPPFSMEKAPGTHWIRTCVGPRAGLAAVKRKTSCSCRESNPGNQVRSTSLYPVKFKFQIEQYLKAVFLNRCAATFLIL